MTGPSSNFAGGNGAEWEGTAAQRADADGATGTVCAAAGAAKAASSAAEKSKRGDVIGALSERNPRHQA
jgi:hypothetical protein